jgi:S1-C subfamily serine protease
MKANSVIWIMVSVVAVGLVFLWLILFRGLWTEDTIQIGNPDITSAWSKSNLSAQPMAVSNPALGGTAPAIIPDAVTGATPRIIAWQTGNVINSIKPAVVGIAVGNTGQPPPWQQGWKVFTPTGKWSVGSGAIVSPLGYVITNYHVVASGGQISVSVFSGDTYQEYPAQLIDGNPNNDLALLKINAPQALPSIPIGNSDKVRTGDQVIAIGNPFGLSQTVTKGIISAKRKKMMIGNVSMRNLLQTDVPINPGNSGGVLCNLKGEVIGVNVAIYSPVESVYTGVSFAIPINQAKVLYGNYIDSSIKPVKYQFLSGQPKASWWPTAVVPGKNDIPFNAANPKNLLGNKRIMPSPGEGIEELAWLGIDLVPAADVGLGVEVDEIEGISPMEAGLQAGDILQAVNGEPTADLYALKEVIKKIPLKKGQGVVIQVFRPRTAQNIFINFRLKDWDIKGR